jgi:putative transposase
VRDGVKYVNKALLVVVGVRTDGHREILAGHVADAEHELTWEGIFSDLKERGLTKVDLIISYGHTGIQSAATRMFTGSSWQMCHVHFIRAVLRKIPRKYHKEIAETLKECLNDSGRLQEFAFRLDEQGFSRAADTIHRFYHGLMNYRAFPPRNSGRRSGLPISWNVSTRNSSDGAKRSGLSRIMLRCLDLPGLSSSILTRNGLQVAGIYL